MIFVVDASVVVDLLLRSPNAGAIETAVLDVASGLCAPDFLRLELLSVLRGSVLGKKITEMRALQALSTFQKLPIAFYSASLVIDRCWQLRNNLTPYDATYLALAERLSATLATCDHAFAAIPSTARVQLF